ncbi:hypothetical protein DFH09DRAFT_1373595 [Mycena vulgaris]|nr:hypothetical protein DFH09DRAFT_1373595 [Mycena vulgaris]
MARRKTVAAVDNTPAAPLAPSPQNQCLRNSDLLEEILRHMRMPDSSSSPSSDLRRFRRSLYAVARTCKSFSSSAVKILWRRLDNLFPLLRVLPSFELNGGVYNLGGIITDSEWAAFDRCAAYVREIVYTETAHSVNSLVYVRLAMRTLPLLPNLLRFECIQSDPPGAEIILCISPSIASLTLQSTLTSSTETFLTMLSADSPNLSHLTLARHPAPILSVCGLFRTLKSVDLRSLRGSITPAAFLALGSIPDLQSFNTDMSGWNPAHLESIPSRSIFCALTHLTVNASPTHLQRNIGLFLPTIGTTQLRSIVIGASHGWDDERESAQTFTAIAHCIASRWSTAVEHLELASIACTPDDFPAMHGITGLHTLNLKHTLRGALSDARVLTIAGTWAELITLSLEGAEADIEFMKCVAQHCGALQSLHVGWFPASLPPIATTPALSHPLKQLTFFRMAGHEARWNSVDLHLIARHLDRMFPHVIRITGESYNHQWAEVGKLVSLCQDVRRTAWEQR